MINSLKIFLPFIKDINPYLEKTQQFSQHEYVYSNFENYNIEYRIINIHWPEAIFKWIEPTSAQLNSFEERIKNWKENSKIVYTLHDERRHKGMTSNFKKLYQLVENNADAFIHLGNYSKKKYQNKFPKAVHKTINHPLYENSYPILDKVLARESLNIDPSAIVLIVPGNIRNEKEKDLVLKSFKKIKNENKVLIATSMRTELKFDFPGRVRLKKIIDFKEHKIKGFKNRYKRPKYHFTYNRLSSQELGLKMSAADIVLIPRINNLNSGLIFLGLTYKKILVGPDKGNMREHLDRFNFPIFDPSSMTSVYKKVGEALQLHNSGYSYKEENLKIYRSKQVVNELDNFMFEIGKR